MRGALKQITGQQERRNNPLIHTIKYTGQCNNTRMHQGTVLKRNEFNTPYYLNTIKKQPEKNRN